MFTNQGKWFPAFNKFISAKFILFYVTLLSKLCIQISPHFHKHNNVRTNYNNTESDMKHRGLRRLTTVNFKRLPFLYL